MKYKKLTDLLILFIIGVSFGKAQYQFDHFTIREGLSENTVTAITKGHDGYMWIGAEGDGLYFWNRQNDRFTHFYSGSDQHPLPNDVINDLWEDDKGNIWLATDENRKATYTNIPGGTYKFRVRKTTTSGKPIGEEADLILKITPPYWDTLIFKITVLVISAGLIILFFIFRMNSMKRINRLLEKQIKERTKEYLETNRKLEEKNDEINTQKEEIEKKNQFLQDQQKLLEEKVKERTQKLEIAKNKAEESDRLKSAFLTNLSHEVRTPLNAIIGFSGLLVDPELSTEHRKEYVDHINHNSINLLHMIDDIIDVSKIEAQTIEISKTETPVNILLTDLYSNYINYKNEIGKKHLRLILNNPYETENLKIFTDSYRVKQIFNNLLTNALKYTNKGYIEYGLRKESDQLVFYVKDTGIGIPKENKELVFEEFVKFENHNEVIPGTGIGLTLSKKLAILLGGNLWFESNEQGGSTFLFTLPLVSSNETKYPLYYNWKNKSILIYEKDNTTFELLKSLLSSTDIKIITAGNHKEFRKALKNQKRNLSIILINIDHIVYDKEIKKALQHIDYQIPKLGITKYPAPNNLSNIPDDLFYEIITKPFSKERFLHFIAKYIG